MRLNMETTCISCGAVADPQFAKCWDAYSPSPLNGIRMQYASQVGTALVDPTLPDQNASNWRQCMRMVI